MASAFKTRESQAEKTLVGIALNLSYRDGLKVNGLDVADLRDALELVSLGRTVVTAERHDGGG